MVKLLKVVEPVAVIPEPTALMVMVLPVGAKVMPELTVKAPATLKEVLYWS
jgi:hypothetical protein